MADTRREQKLITAFATLADTMIDTYDMADLLHTLLHECTELMPVDAGRIVLRAAGGGLQLVASFSEGNELVEIMQLDAESGPGVDCLATGQPVVVEDLADSEGRWLEFRPAALELGFRSIHAVPMTLRRETIGAMVLFNRRVGVLSERDAILAQALAGAATIGILHERSVRESNVVAAQLKRALDSRIVVEQAKGILAASKAIGISEAFSAMRSHARGNNLSIHAVAKQIIDRTLDIEAAPSHP